MGSKESREGGDLGKASRKSHDVETEESREGHDFSRAEKTRHQRIRPLAAGVRLHLQSLVADPDGTKLLRDSREGDDPQQLGEDAGAALLTRGADEILDRVYRRGTATPQQP